MYSFIAEAIEDWKRESNKTARIFEALTDDSLRQEITPEDRTLGFLAWHIVMSMSRMSGHLGLTTTAIVGNEDECPATPGEISKTFRLVAGEQISLMEDGLKDESLEEERDFHGSMQRVGLTMKFLVFHQAHHRGQMVVLMRQAGLRPPGVHGPTREDFIGWGLDPRRSS